MDSLIDAMTWNATIMVSCMHALHASPCNFARLPAAPSQRARYSCDLQGKGSRLHKPTGVGNKEEGGTKWETVHRNTASPNPPVGPLWGAKVLCKALYEPAAVGWAHALNVVDSKWGCQQRLSACVGFLDHQWKILGAYILPLLICTLSGTLCIICPGVALITASQRWHPCQGHIT